VKIPLDRQLVLLRADAQRADPHRGEAALFEGWSRLWSRPAGYRATAKTAGKALSPLLGRLVGADDGWLPKVPFPFAGWTSGRDAREPAAVPFHERWRRARGGGGAVRGVVAGPANGVDEPTGETGTTAPAPAPSHAASMYEFRRRFEELDGRTHVAGSLEEARKLAREIAGDGTVARWQGDALDGIGDATAEPLDADLSVIEADVAIGETGQVGWRHGEGRPRAAGVLPPRQVILVDQDDVVATLEEGVRKVGTGSVVLVAGPSRTADIEQRVIRGMHAPRDVDVILYQR
jgi:L-lactate utilization protein LutC